MHTQDDSVHLRGDATACVIWIQNTLVSGRRGEFFWGQAEVVPDRGGPLGAPKAASYPQPVGTIQ